MMETERRVAEIIAELRSSGSVDALRELASEKVLARLEG
jgi:hypothetical protein